MVLFKEYLQEFKMAKKDVLIWIPVIAISGILYYSVKEEKVVEVEGINHAKTVETVQTVKKDSFVGIEDEVLNTAIDKIDPELYRQKEQKLLQGRRYTIDDSFKIPLRRVIVSDIERQATTEALKSLLPNENYEMNENKPTYSFPTISIELKRNPQLVPSGNHKRYNIEYEGIASNKDIQIIENTTSLQNSLGNLNVAITFDYSDDVYKAQRDIYEVNGSMRSQENDVYPENYIIPSLEQTLKIRMDGVQSTTLLDVPNEVIIRTEKSPKDYICTMERRYFSNIGSSFNADYLCDGLPNINDYVGKLDIMFKK